MMHHLSVCIGWMLWLSLIFHTSFFSQHFLFKTHGLIKSSNLTDRSVNTTETNIYMGAHYYIMFKRKCNLVILSLNLLLCSTLNGNWTKGNLCCRAVPLKHSCVVDR